MLAPEQHWKEKHSPFLNVSKFRTINLTCRFYLRILFALPSRTLRVRNNMYNLEILCCLHPLQAGALTDVVTTGDGWGNKMVLRKGVLLVLLAAKG